MYPLIQTHVWAKIGGEHGLLKMVLDSFIKVCVCVGRGEKVGGRWGDMLREREGGHHPSTHPHNTHTHNTHTPTQHTHIDGYS